METIGAMVMASLGYILKAAAESKTAVAAKEQILGKFWEWIRPKFIKDVPGLEQAPDSPETEKQTFEALTVLLKDEEFFTELTKRVNELRSAGITGKNIVYGNISGVKKIRIGDKEYNPNEQYSHKNIVNGNVENADEFTLGDGH